MISSLKLQQVLNPAVRFDSGYQFSANSVALRSLNLLRGRLHSRRLALLCLKSDNSSSFEPSTLISSLGSPSPPPKWNLTQRNILVLNFVACATAVSATLFFLSAIPTLLAFKKTAESLEKLLDVTREELPDTMAAVRLSGMEISDLTMELSDLGQGISQGVRNSTRAVRLAQERLQQLTNMTTSASMQVVVPTETEQVVPAIARTARQIREGIVKSCSFIQMLFSITKFSRMVFKYFKSRVKSEA